MTQNNPFADAFKAFDAFKSYYPSSTANFDEAIAMSKRNIEAFQEAGQVLVEGVQQIVSLQTKIAEQNAKQVMALFNSIASSKDPRESAAKQASYAQEAFEKAASDAKQLADIATKSSSKAGDLLKAQVTKNIQEVSKVVSKKPAAAERKLHNLAVS